MRQEQALALAGVVRFMRENTVKVSLSIAEVLALVVAGYSTVDEIAEATGLSVGTVRTQLHYLRGRPRCRGDRQVSDLQLVERFRHPHRPGAWGWRLSPQGEQLLAEIPGGHQSNRLQRNALHLDS